MLDKLSYITDYAKSIGIEEIDVMFLKTYDRTVSSRDNRIENVEEITSGKYFVRLLKNHKLISLSFNMFDDYNEIISSSYNVIDFIPADKYVGFFKDIDTTNIYLSNNGEFLDFDNLISCSKEISRLSMLGNNINNLETCSVSSQKIEKYIVSTNGFKTVACTVKNSYYLNLIAMDKLTNNSEQDYSFFVSKYGHCDLNNFVDECVQRCNRKLNAKKLKTGLYHVIIERRAAMEFIKHFVTALNGELISNKGSFLCDSIGNQIFNESINIYDDPIYQDGLFFSNFDDEGRKIERVNIVEKGILQHYFLDTYNAKKLGLAANRGFNKGGVISSGYTNLFVESDHKETFENICLSKDNIIYVTDFIGMGVNIANGNYSRGISGNIIIDGKVVDAVSEITLSGNLLNMYKDMILLDDTEYENGISISSIYVGELMVSGE